MDKLRVDTGANPSGEFWTAPDWAGGGCLGETARVSSLTP